MYDFQPDEALLTKAYSTLAVIRTNRALIEAIANEGASEDWFTGLFGTPESRIACYEAEISDKRQLLQALKDELQARGHNIVSLRAMWREMGGSKVVFHHAA